MKINQKYTTTTVSKPSKPGCWDILDVYVHLTDKEGNKTQIGHYERNYTSLFNTFCPFFQNGREYALFSKEYTATRIMTLPDCKDIGGEESSGNGFCPTDYFVPGVGRGKFGFIAGCIWGDDWSWKIQYLDLSKVSKGIVIRDERFGYISLPKNMKLRDAINMEDYFEKGLLKEYPDEDCKIIEIAHSSIFNLDILEKEIKKEIIEK